MTVNTISSVIKQDEEELETYFSDKKIKIPEVDTVCTDVFFISLLI